MPGNITISQRKKVVSLPRSCALIMPNFYFSQSKPVSIPQNGTCYIVLEQFVYASRQRDMRRHKAQRHGEIEMNIAANLDFFFFFRNSIVVGRRECNRRRSLRFVY